MVNIVNDVGKISITSEVLTYLAGDAATSCFGVKGMAGRSKEGGPLQLLRRESMSKGVSTHFNDDDTLSLELHIGVDNGVNIGAVCRSIIKEVSYKRLITINYYVEMKLWQENSKQWTATRQPHM